jgi:thiamine biosynthesis lipoprotein
MKSSSSSVSRSRPLLGTFVAIRICGEESVIGCAFEAIERVQRLMSAHDPDSDLARISRAAPGSRVRIDPWTHEVLGRAKELHSATDALFDCAVTPVLLKAGYLPCHAPAIPAGSLADLELLPDGIVHVRRAVALTLDGIAKGYAVDRAVQALRHAGVRAGVVNAGGDLRLFGEQAEAVHVRDPYSPGRFVHVGDFRDAAVASSTGPVVDPRTMTLRHVPGAVTVIAKDCTTADALTKPCLLDCAGASGIAARFGAQALPIH